MDPSGEAYLDLTLQKGPEVRRLRFLNPQSLRIEKGFPESPGLFIADISGRQLEGLRIEVGDFENGGGGIYFWAKDVVDLDASGTVG